MKGLHGYPSSYAITHKAMARLWEGPVVAQEKVDGSQISFGVINGELKIRSRRQEIHPGHAGMFQKAVETIQALAPDLEPGFTYRGEYLRQAKHNVLRYERVPRGHIILYDVDMGEENYMIPYGLAQEAERIGLECVPFYGWFEGPPDQETLQELLATPSILGGPIEGVMFKNYTQFGPDKKILLGKVMREEFKESHAKEWRNQNPGRGDLILNLIERYRTEARWQKAVQHLREQGVLVNAPQDIGHLLKEISQDLKAEAEEEIKEALFKHFWKEIARGVIKGAPEWYKAYLQEEMNG